MSETKKSNFEEIQRSETKEAIIPRRNKKFPNLVNKHVDNEDIRENPEDLVGLALSGGGIRSAMFNLGLLRAMKQSGFLRYVDYISSVSGGGYISAYYAAIGHYRDKQKESELNDKQDDKQDELSKFDDSFLVDGKYLLDLFTVPTTYLFATIPYFITVLSFLIILSSSIAWLFRLFDYPHARRWLQLLDLKTDLQVGIFASCIVLVVFCLLSCALYCRNYISRILSKSSGLAWEPRKPSLITKASLLAGVACFFCGCAVMIGNGDFDFSASPLATSNKINLRGLILPIAAVILVLFFPLIRARPLARSERAAGTSWKQILVFIASYGTVLGSIFVALCIMGSENISGFIGRRPPTLQKHDVHDIQLLASLSKDPAIDSRLKKMDSKHCGSVFPRYATPPDEINIDKLIEVINEIADSRFQEELNLWPEKKFDDTLAREQYPKDRDYETTWTWTGYQSTPIRWFNTLCGALNFNTKAKAYVNYDRDLFEVHGPHLLHRFNLAIKPIYLIALRAM
jgi:hypothetical protein